MSTQDKETLRTWLESWLNTNPILTHGSIQQWLNEKLKLLHYTLASVLFVDFVMECINGNGTNSARATAATGSGVQNSWTTPIVGGPDA